MEEKEQLVAIPVEEYAELIECKTRINAVYGMITNQHVCHLKSTGYKANVINTSLLEVVSGYDENENYFNSLSKEFFERSCGNAY